MYLQDNQVIYESWQKRIKIGNATKEDIKAYIDTHFSLVDKRKLHLLENISNYLIYKPKGLSLDVFDPTYGIDMPWKEGDLLKVDKIISNLYPNLKWIYVDRVDPNNESFYIVKDATNLVEKGLNIGEIKSTLQILDI